MARRKDKKPVLRWWGLLAEFARARRWMVGAVLCVACVSLAFTQLGFLGLGTRGEFSAYAVVMLIPITLAALMLGPLGGFAIGLVGGSVLYAHALLMPLGYYEIAFITPFITLLAMPLTGLLIGILFALALRNEPSRKKSVIRIVIICVVVSWLFSLAFMTNVFFSILTNLMGASTGGVTHDEIMNAVESVTLRSVMRLGNIGLQAWTDAALMAVASIISFFIIEEAKRLEGIMRLRTLFRSWLGVVVAVAFMITAAISYVAVTETELRTAEKNMRNECAYLINQLESSDARIMSFVDFFNEIGFDLLSLSDEQLSGLVDALSFRDLLVGYSEENDGIVAIFTEAGTLLISDTPFSANFPTIQDCFDEEVIWAIKQSVETNQTQRTMYSYNITSLIPANEADKLLHTEIGFLTAVQQSGFLVVIMVPASMVFADRLAAVGSSLLSSAVLLLSVFFIVSRLLDQVVAKRIDETNNVLESITAGNLDATVEHSDTIEFNSLATGINTTVNALKGWIAEAETRMDSELAAAKSIQESALPRTFPPFPNIPHFDVFASMDPAREVGGDFYDFFLLGDDATPEQGKLGFLVADVSGKGVPASLFMMKAKALIHDAMESGMELGAAIESANHQLCVGNDANMFVTAWIGVLDYATGHVDYVNAGHNPPMLRSGEDGSWQWLRKKSGIPLGSFDGLPYKAHSLECKPGDTFVIYSDGVTEAMDVDGQLYGEPQLETLLNSLTERHPHGLVGCVWRDVKRYAGEAEQSDDITILSLEVGVPPESPDDWAD